MSTVYAVPRISHKVVTLIGKEENTRPNLRFTGDNMYYLGIDIGKNNHNASVISENGKPLFRGFTFANTSEGGESLLAKLANHNIPFDELEIGLEATGHYWLSVYSFLHDKGGSFGSRLVRS
jgi:hypothetical protein